MELSSFTMNNGMTVFVLTDETSALVHTEFVSRGGYRNQTPYTKGFFNMYSDLFLADAKKNSFIRLCGTKSECTIDDAVFSADIPCEYLGKYLKELDECISADSFSSYSILEASKKYSDSTCEYKKSSAGFTTGTVNSIFFSPIPWEFESMQTGPLFDMMGIDEIKSVLSEIRNEYYTHEKCALFLAGNITKERAYDICGKSFSSYSEPSFRTYFSSEEKKSLSEEKENENDTKNFILVSDDFSYGMTQILIQYKSLSSKEGKILSEEMNATDSPFKKSIVEDSDTCIKNDDYMTVENVEDEKTPRFCMQALIEDDFDDIKKITDKIVLHITENSSINEERLEKARERQYVRDSENIGSSRKLCRKLSEFWARTNFKGNNLYDEYMESLEKNLDASPEKIAQKIESEKPYVFVFMNSKRYEETKNKTGDSDFAIIMRNSYEEDFHEEHIAEKEKEEFQRFKKNVSEKTIELSPSEYFYYNNIKNIRQTTLSNSIPLTVKENKGTKTAAACIRISGGMQSNGPEQMYMRELIVSSLCKIAKIDGISSKTTGCFSYITFEVSRENFQEAMTAFTDALIFSDIPPVTADRVLSEKRHEILMKKNDLGMQLRQKALEHMFRNTDMKDYFNQDEEKLKNISYSSLLANCTALLDASLYSIVFAGDFSEDEVKSIMEKTMGLLKSQNPSAKPECLKPDFDDGTLCVELSHLFTSDKPVELAPKESPVLVPTKEFHDPSQLYFESPSDSVLFNALLQEIESRLVEELGGETTCSIDLPTKEIQAGSITAYGLKTPDIFFDAYEKVIECLKFDLEDMENQKENLEKIKCKWILKNLSATDANIETAKLICTGLENETPAKYLDDYLTIQGAEEKDFIEVLDTCLTKPRLRVVSKDNFKTEETQETENTLENTDSQLK